MSTERETLENGLSGQYVLERELGRGGMATVWLARDLKHKRPVALKVLRGELAMSLGPERFRREIETAARLQHPHILSVHDSGETAGHLWYTMPYVRGESLRDRLRRDGCLPVGEAIRITGEAAQALQHAHSEGVVHRDIKPENILLTADGSTLVADFGIARALAGTTGETQHLTETGLALGTPAYMAPEQALGERHVDSRADQYALAATCYEMLTGSPPFSGPTAAALIAQRFTNPVPPSVTDERPGMPTHLDAVLRRALALKTDDRFASVVEFQRALATGADAAAPTTAVTRPPRAPRRRMLFASLALLGLGLSGVLILNGSVDGLQRGKGDGGQALPVPTPVAPGLITVLALPDSADGNFVGEAYAGELARGLSQVTSLRVVQPEAPARYHEGTDRFERIARDLRVTSVLESSVRVRDGVARVELRLLAVPTGRVLWSHTGERPARELAGLRSELVRGVAGALNVRLPAGESERVDRLPTVVPAAYSEYLRATALSDGNRSENEAGMAILREAIRLDSTFALAWAALGRRHMVHAFFVSMTYRDSGLAAVQRALELNPELDEAHFVQGDLLALTGRPATARYAYLKAIELNPSHAPAMADLSDAEATIGRFDESLYWALRGLALYPNSPPLHNHVARPLGALDTATAMRWLQAGEQRWPWFSRPQVGLSVLALLGGRDRDALARLRRHDSVYPGDVEVQVVLAQTAWITGAADGDSLVEVQYRLSPDARPYGLTPQTFRTLVAATRLRRGDSLTAWALADTALAAAHSELERGGEDPGPVIEMAALHLLRGRRREALEDLERAHKLGYREYRWLRRDPFLRTLRGEPRLESLLAQMESEVAVMRRRAMAANDTLFAGGGRT